MHRRHHPSADDATNRCVQEQRPACAGQLAAKKAHPATTLSTTLILSASGKTSSTLAGSGAELRELQAVDRLPLPSAKRQLFKGDRAAVGSPPAPSPQPGERHQSSTLTVRTDDPEPTRLPRCNPTPAPLGQCANTTPRPHLTHRRQCLPNLACTLTEPEPQRMGAGSRPRTLIAHRYAGCALNREGHRAVVGPHLRFRPRGLFRPRELHGPRAAGHCMHAASSEGV